MTDDSANPGGPAAGATSAPSLPAAVDRTAFQAELDRLRAREKAHTREGDAIAAARRRLPMVEVDASLALTGPHGPVTLLDAFEGRRQLIAYYFMWWDGHPAAKQCEGCTFYTSQVGELSYLHSRDITYAVLCQGPYDESIRYRGFMGWTMPWYAAKESLDTLLVGRRVGMMHLVCYLRQKSKVFEQELQIRGASAPRRDIPARVIWLRQAIKGAMSPSLSWRAALRISACWPCVAIARLAVRNFCSSSCHDNGCVASPRGAVTADS